MADSTHKRISLITSVTSISEREKRGQVSKSSKSKLKCFYVNTLTPLSLVFKFASASITKKVYNKLKQIESGKVYGKR
jgi:hypothetical protein